jgi:plasmid stabilization system protein ParE
MAFELRWAPAARLDLKDLAAYIAESRPEASAHFISQVFRSVERLRDFPESGTRRCRRNPKFEARNPKQARMTETQILKRHIRRAAAFRSFEFS